MTKSFKIARKPGQVNGEKESVAPEVQRKTQARQSTANKPVAAHAAPTDVGSTTRKTIEVPEDYFYKVKMRALERHMREKELWAEILDEYFNNHPAL
jgi:hypothetical protein